MNAPLFDPLAALGDQIATLQVEREAKTAEEARQATARAAQPQEAAGPTLTVMRQFNAAVSLEEVLLAAGYAQSGNAFKHPNSESGSYSATVRGGRVHALSPNDPLYTGGGGGGAHDAFSAMRVLVAGGDMALAIQNAQQWLSGNDFDPIVGASASSGFRFPEPIDPAEWGSARSTPDCIVENYLWADVGLLIAPGAVGKTTLQLYEAIHIALGLPLHGLEIRRPGPVLFVTAEDNREMLVARLRSIAEELWLSDDQISLLWDRVRISDLSGAGFKLTTITGDTVRPAPGVKGLIEACQANPPALIVIDPAVSFGVGESRVNDAEQGLIEVARRIRNALNCCVRFIHHSGKANAREQTLDQYSGRGGSAFADGARMVSVIATLDSNSFRKATGRALQEGENGIVLARPKTTYAAPQAPLYIVRRGYTFERVSVAPGSVTDSPQANSMVVLSAIQDALLFGDYPTKASIQAICSQLGMTRQSVRDAIALLISSRQIEERPREKHGSRGGAHSYLAIASAS